MARVKKHTAEQIVNLLRWVEVVIGRVCLPFLYV